MAYQQAPVVPSFSVMDMVTSLYGDLDLISQFLLDNPDIGQYGVDADLELFAGQNVAYDPSLANFVPAPLSFSPPPAQVVDGFVIGQAVTTSVYDLCIQAYGTLDLLSVFMQDNAINGVSDVANGDYVYQLALVQSNQLNKYNVFNQVTYATLYSTSTQPPGLAVLLMEIAGGPGGPYVLLENSADIALENQN